MLFFTCDYSEGAHESILRRLMETNLEPQPGYGQDAYCDAAKEKIRTACGCPDADVFFLVGGTQTNQTVIASMLRPYEGVLAAETGHVAVHESGAIECTGHKVITLPAHDGKVDAQDVDRWVNAFNADENHEHTVFPGMVYISHPTESGTLYTLAELEALSKVCRTHHIPLFLDGARLGYGLVSPGTDVTLQDVARLTDVFYIGGTKVGALCGEAVVFPHGGMPAHFVAMVKQRGALLAKGRLLGIQFDTLFSDNLYLRISQNAIDMAGRLRTGFRRQGYAFHPATVTNQIFVELDDAQRERLSKDVVFSAWEPLEDGRGVYRFATSWATTAEDVDALIRLL